MASAGRFRMGLQMLVIAVILARLRSLRAAFLRALALPRPLDEAHQNVQHI